RFPKLGGVFTHHPGGLQVFIMTDMLDHLPLKFTVILGQFAGCTFRMFVYDFVQKVSQNSPDGHQYSKLWINKKGKGHIYGDHDSMLKGSEVGTECTRYSIYLPSHRILNATYV